MKNVLALMEAQRRAMGLTYKDMSAKSGLMPNTVRGIMQGWQSPKHETLCALANALDIEVEVVAKTKSKPSKKMKRQSTKTTQEFDGMTPYQRQIVGAKALYRLLTAPWFYRAVKLQNRSKHGHAADQSTGDKGKASKGDA